MSKPKYTKKQIRENRKAWIAALRSGKYKQTKGKLKSRNGAYCCLGVLCEVAEVPKVYDTYDRAYIYGNPEGSWGEYSSSSLPKVAQEWLGVPTEGPELAKPVTIKDKYGDEFEVTSLIGLNDDYGWTFEQIAEAIEKNGLKDD